MIKYDTSFVRRDKETRARHGKPWTPEDRANLERLFKQAVPLKDICEELQRPADGTMNKLVQWRMVIRDTVGVYQYTYFVSDQYFKAHQLLNPYYPKTQPQPETKEANMSNAPVIENKTFIAGVDATTMSDEDIFKKIYELENAVSKWDAMKTKPEKLKKKIAATQDDIAKLAAYVDSRD